MTNEKDTEVLLSARQAAAYLGVTYNTLAVWRCIGPHRITHIKVGKLVKYRKSALDAFLKSKTVL